MCVITNYELVHEIPQSSTALPNQDKFIAFYQGHYYQAIAMEDISLAWDEKIHRWLIIALTALSLGTLLLFSVIRTMAKEACLGVKTIYYLHDRQMITPEMVKNLQIPGVRLNARPTAQPRLISLPILVSLHDGRVTTIILYEAALACLVSSLPEEKIIWGPHRENLVHVPIYESKGASNILTDIFDRYGQPTDFHNTWQEHWGHRPPNWGPPATDPEPYIKLVPVLDS